VLIVIDNLETVHGDEFYALDDALQDKEVAFLLTSREGLPDRTQTKTVGPLDKESAEQLFRSLAKNSDEFDAAGLTSERIDDALRKLRYSPLAIRWFILSIEAGRTPTDVLRNQDELLRYCVGNVVDGLGSDDMTLLKVIQALDRPLSFDELAVISEIDIDILRRGAQRLIQRSLLVRTQAPGDNETELLSLSSAARKYLAPIRDLDVLEGVHGRERAYTKEREIERRWSADHGFYFDPKNIFERPNHNDQPVAYLLRRALREMKAGRPEAASATMTRARALNPGYFEVDRIDAFFSSITGRSGSATALYRSALSKCESETERCWIGYFYSAHLARTVRDIPDPISVAERTHAFFRLL